MSLKEDRKRNEMGKMNLKLYDIDEEMVWYVGGGKDIKEIDVVIEVNKEGRDCLYIDEWEIEDKLLILRK